MENLNERRLLPNSVYKLFDNPNVYLVQGIHSINWLMSRPSSGDTVLISIMWRLTIKSLLNYWKIVYKLKGHGYKPIIMCNEPIEVLRCRLVGLNGILMNQNQFIIEDALHLPHKNRKLEYDAFYSAQAKKFKRLNLASEIEKLYVLTYSCPTNDNGENNLSLVEPSIQGATWNKSYVHDFDVIIKTMHQSGVALALSKEEGAMWAVVEALLCGLPIVSTKSRGGRDRYFTPETSKIVAAKSKAVKQGVEDFCSNLPDPARIREVTLRKMEIDRRYTIEFFQSKILPSGAYTDAEVYQHLFRKGETRRRINIEEKI